MNKEEYPITEEIIIELSKRAAESVKEPELFLNTKTEIRIMFIISDIAKIVDAQFAKPYHMRGPESMPMKTADAALSILKLLGVMAKVSPFRFLSEEQIEYEFDQGLILTQCPTPLAVYRIISKIVTNDLGHQPYWYIAECLQKALILLFANADNHFGDLLDKIETKLNDHASKSE